MHQFFITGTDTDAGKTHVTSLLLKLLAQHKKRAIGFKPIASGCEMAFEQLVNADALMLMESATVSAKYDIINPFAFAPPIAPHIAAEQAGLNITVEKLSMAYQHVKQQGADYLLTEGAGGWALPINNNEYLYDWVKAEQLPVILVVGMKLGCINHALLTAAHMQSMGVNCVGWIANQVDATMDEYQANLDSLITRLPFPLLAISPYREQTPKLQIYKTLLEKLSINP
ncbi:dithiobiotin synthetase [Pseudoalteromonas issachenkonii]|uniref:ATP-dependent dethiobiotin synthetase BioD n=1 Tax=Pseudoalteromonas issachenkonii TaxID=152297 RepID=A0ABM6N3F9_9GAMM|nr:MULTISPECIES: dethiobiotin synthase [Pseudoalteromonas]MAY57995.1 dethiobiotin synthase [Pseudoalteromonas sp.]ALQ54823.1 dithiobiotin synthetase [Pseudoalteromonas issachenkonii]ATC90643.1 dethiobiotin synthetase [Pseudoalteromonas issachenkonii]MDN3403717.1 dethiobiotin synthase [Pseudoalteromonas sp. APC 3218]MDN3407556.1 dethiobiotin synthase [Pseudoalteromonas sp. APC 3894]|tara:strand:+ start:9845 stop:10528 length:684 start_codon:yes stop_codon:yes gene_type:complete